MTMFCHRFAIAALLATMASATLPDAATAQTAPGQAAGAQATVPAREARKLSVDDAVRQALEHNLGIQLARVNPQLQDLVIAQTLTAWSPSLTATGSTAGTDTPNASFLAGAAGDEINDHRYTGTVGIRQATKWHGASFALGWDNTRATTNNLFTNFNPQVNSSVSFSVVQPLLRNFKIDNVKQQLEVGKKNRQNSDLDVQASIATTSRAVRNAYWDLAFAIESLAVTRQSLDLARESLRNNKARVEIGTMAPIDIVEAEAEVAQRDEAVIVAEAAIDRAEDTLRALIFDPSAADFWTVKIEPTDRPPFSPLSVNVDVAVAKALESRTDLKQAQTSIEATDVSLRFLTDQTLPEVNAQLDYGLNGLGGTQAIRGAGFPGPITGFSQRSFGAALGDIFQNQYPRWTFSVNVNYPLGQTSQQANLARTKLQQSQAKLQLRNQQLQVATQVRDAARTLSTNQKRVGSTRASRSLAERRLDAEQKKFAAGQSTSFFVFQAQRDLAQAQSNELRAILDYNKSAVDFETIQQAPLTGGAGLTGAGAATGAATPPTTAAVSGSSQQRGF
jgi:outer membrane protein TolC